MKSIKSKKYLYYTIAILNLFPFSWCKQDKEEEHIFFKNNKDNYVKSIKSKTVDYLIERTEKYHVIKAEEKWYQYPYIVMTTSMLIIYSKIAPV